ncbi:unnamed protein product [Victoria cruziana]
MFELAEFRTTDEDEERSDSRRALTAPSPTGQKVLGGTLPMSKGGRRAVPFWFARKQQDRTNGEENLEKAEVVRVVLDILVGYSLCFAS